MTRETLFALALGYVLGSIPFGLLLTRLSGRGDVRDIGSGSIGATNVLRTGSKWLAVLTAVLDCLKGTAAVLIACTVGVVVLERDAAVPGGVVGLVRPPARLAGRASRPAVDVEEMGL